MIERGTITFAQSALCVERQVANCVAAWSHQKFAANTANGIAPVRQQVYVDKRFRGQRLGIQAIQRMPQMQRTLIQGGLTGGVIFLSSELLRAVVACEIGRLPVHAPSVHGGRHRGRQGKIRVEGQVRVGRLLRLLPGVLFALLCLLVLLALVDQRVNLAGVVAQELCWKSNVISSATKQERNHGHTS